MALQPQASPDSHAEAEPTSPARPPRASVGRAFLGLALLGWGLSILLGVTPHEDRFVGAGLTVFGFALLVTAPALPEFRALPRTFAAAGGAAVVAAMAGFQAVHPATLDGPRVVLILLAIAVMAAAPFLALRLPLANPKRSVTVASLVVASCVALGVPLAVWAIQAVAKGPMETTPMESFVRFGLIAPLSLLLQGLGWHPSVDGQTLTYATPRGPLAVQVGAACSGIQAMALFTGVLALFLWVERPGGRRLAMWSAIGIAGVYVANLLRLAFLTMVGYQWGSPALLRAHAQAGWIFFVAWAIAFAWLARRAPRPT